jgi:predicted enzyme related to lactoylglutathione lyase
MAVKFAKAMIEVGILTGDVERSLAFYRDFLGLPFIGEFKYPGGVQHRMAIGESVLKINYAPDRPKPAPAPGGGLAGGVAGFRYVSFAVEDLAGVVGEAERLGYAVTTPVTWISPTVAYAMIADPDGNCIDLFQPD